MNPESSAANISLQEYVLLREEIRHQDNLVNARLSWLVSSQAFLLSGFAVTLSGTAQALQPVYAKVNLVLFASLPIAGLVTDIELRDDLGGDSANAEHSASRARLASAKLANHPGRPV